jgi:hypothetical protein
MKKFYVFALTALAVLAVSCTMNTAPELPGTITKDFTVEAPVSTRTELSGMDIHWSTGDEINVVAKTSGNQYTFTLKEGAGTSSAKFSGSILEEDAAETEFVAVYPNVAIRTASLPVIEFDKTMGRNRTAVKDGFDPGQSVLTAVSDNGSFSFRHGSAYFKIQVSDDNVDSLVLHTSSARFSGRPKYNEDGSYNNVEGAKPDVVLAPASGTLEKGATYYIPVLCKNSTLKVLTLTAYNHNGKSTSFSTEKKSTVKLELGKVYDLGCPDISVEPVVTVLTASVTGVSADAATGLTLADAYSVRNGTDANVTVTFDGTVITAASINGGTVTYSISANTGSARDGWIGLNTEGGAVKKITISQLAAGATEHYVWDFSSAEWQAEFAKYGNANTLITNWNLTYDGLTIVSAAKSKYEATYFQWGGKGSIEDRYMTFTASGAGTLKVTASNTGSSADNERKVAVVVGSSDEVSQAGGSAATSPTVCTFEIAAGTVKIYATKNALRFYKIEFTGK